MSSNHVYRYFNGLHNVGGDMEDFYKELEGLINKYSKENASNTPDWILAQYLLGCLSAFEMATQQRETWYGRDAAPSVTRVLNV